MGVSSEEWVEGSSLQGTGNISILYTEVTQIYLHCVKWVEKNCCYIVQSKSQMSVGTLIHRTTYSISRQGLPFGEALLPISTKDHGI